METDDEDLAPMIEESRRNSEQVREEISKMEEELAEKRRQFQLHRMRETRLALALARQQTKRGGGDAPGISTAHEGSSKRGMDPPQLMSPQPTDKLKFGGDADKRAMTDALKAFQDGQESAKKVLKMHTLTLPDLNVHPEGSIMQENVYSAQLTQTQSQAPTEMAMDVDSIMDESKAEEPVSTSSDTQVPTHAGSVSMSSALKSTNPVEPVPLILETAEEPSSPRSSHPTMRIEEQASGFPRHEKRKSPSGAQASTTEASLDKLIPSGPYIRANEPIGPGNEQNRPTSPAKKKQRPSKYKKLTIMIPPAAPITASIGDGESVHEHSASHLRAESLLSSPHLFTRNSEASPKEIVTTTSQHGLPESKLQGMSPRAEFALYLSRQRSLQHSTSPGQISPLLMLAGAMQPHENLSPRSDPAKSPQGPQQSHSAKIASSSGRHLPQWPSTTPHATSPAGQIWPLLMLEGATQPQQMNLSPQTQQQSRATIASASVNYQQQHEGVYPPMAESSQQASMSLNPFHFLEGNLLTGEHQLPHMQPPIRSEASESLRQDHRSWPEASPSSGRQQEVPPQQPSPGRPKHTESPRMLAHFPLHMLEGASSSPSEQQREQNVPQRREIFPRDLHENISPQNVERSPRKILREALLNAQIPPRNPQQSSPRLMSPLHQHMTSTGVQPSPGRASSSIASVPNQQQEQHVQKFHAAASAQFHRLISPRSFGGVRTSAQHVPAGHPQQHQQNHPHHQPKIPPSYTHYELFIFHVQVVSAEKSDFWVEIQASSQGQRVRKRTSGDRHMVDIEMIQDSNWHLQEGDSVQVRVTRYGASTVASASDRQSLSINKSFKFARDRPCILFPFEDRGDAKIILLSSWEHQPQASVQLHPAHRTQHVHNDVVGQQQGSEAAEAGPSAGNQLDISIDDYLGQNHGAGEGSSSGQQQQSGSQTGHWYDGDWYAGDGQ